MGYVAVLFSVTFYHGIGDILQFCFLYTASIMTYGICCSSVFCIPFLSWQRGYIAVLFMFTVSIMAWGICCSSVFCNIFIRSVFGIPFLSWHRGYVTVLFSVYSFNQDIGEMLQLSFSNIDFIMK